MAHLNLIGGLRRELHYIKVAHDEDSGYEPTLVILSHTRTGRSFMIPLGCMYKYVEPMSYTKDEKYLIQDMLDYREIIRENIRISQGQSPSGILCFRPSTQQMREAVENLSAAAMAFGINKSSKILLCTAYNLCKLMQMFEITPSPQAAAQLLLWIQDGLDELKNMPENPERDHETVVGEGTVKIGDRSFTSEIKVSETQVVESGMN